MSCNGSESAMEIACTLPDIRWSQSGNGKPTSSEIKRKISESNENCMVWIN